MLFNSFDFLFFFPIVVTVYYFLSHKNRIIWLLLASYFFYFYWEPALVFLLFTSTVIDYYCGIKIHQNNKDIIRKLYLYISIFINIGLLLFFKYLGFLTETTVNLLQFFGLDINSETTLHSYNINKILLPVGISFYTFQTLSYSIDIYRKKINPERSFVKYALYVSFFPQLVAGPIERANRLLPQFYKKIQLNIPVIKQGLVMMAWGFFLKLVVADRIGIYVDQVFASPSIYKGLPLILGSYFFTFQIYYDFSAYTAIAIGAAKVLGIDLIQNFNRPLFAKNMGEFWQRWHISLLAWLNDYIYRPLAKRNVDRYLIILIIFFSVGLWHGANWTFVVWGLLNGVFLIFEVGTKRLREKIVKGIEVPIPDFFYQFSWWLICISFMTFSLIFFRSPSFDIANEYLSNIVLIRNLQINILDDRFELILSFILIFFVQIVHYFKGNNKIYELVVNRSLGIRWLIYIGYILCIVMFSINRQNNFIYFQF